jgi:hypothetical protein
MTPHAAQPSIVRSPWRSKKPPRPGGSTFQITTTRQAARRSTPYPAALAMTTPAPFPANRRIPERQAVTGTRSRGKVSALPLPGARSFHPSELNLPPKGGNLTAQSRPSPRQSWIIQMGYVT